ncbi:MAG TPA: apolipoprotein N-acyltransferase, partial [Bacteroidota bacterium]
VENRRWVVQCANGGISAFIDPAGQIHQGTTMYTVKNEFRAIEPRNGETFYMRYGDLFAGLCVALAFAFVAVSTFISYFRK